MSRRDSVVVAAALLVLVATSVSMSYAPAKNGNGAHGQKSQTYTVKPGPQAEHELQGLFIRAVPGDVIQLEEGTYEFQQELICTQDNITIRGRGHDKTILSFKKQNAGSKGIEATGDALVMENFAVEDTLGNAIKVLGSNGVTFRGVRTEWTGGPKESNGAYGLYPVQCKNVLIEDCIAIGASDAGIYVGQSQNIIVRRSRAEFNVAGIEIENSIHADVYENVSTNNTGGILVFDLPGLELANGQSVRVFNNDVYANNTKNFAPPGNIVGNVPPGTGVTVMAMTDVEIFNNRIRDNNTINVAVYSYLISGNPITDKNFGPYSERVSIHDNVIIGGGKQPGGPRGEMLKAVLGPTFPQIFYDGVANPEKLVDGKLPKEEGVVLANNGDADFANLRFDLLSQGKVDIDRNIANYTGQLAPLPEVKLAAHQKPNPAGDPAVAVYRDAPEKLSAYGLFEGNGATQQPAEGVIPYDLNTELFADYMTKQRFIKVPRGETVSYVSDDVFDFPVGTVVAKTFAAPVEMADKSKGEKLIETRIIERKDTGWYGYAYLWNDEQTEATLSLGGGTKDVAWVHGDGEHRENNYIIPNANQCKSCHVNTGSFNLLGPKARNLNKDFAYSDGTENQLARWARLGILRGAPAADSAPKVAQSENPKSGSLDERARAWLDVNCAHCHNPQGPARTTGLDLSITQTDPAKLGVWKTPVAAGRGAGKAKFGIVPGDPDKSIMLYRLDSTEPGVMMPELPRRLIHKEGVALIREWIASMPPSDPPKAVASGAAGGE